MTHVCSSLQPFAERLEILEQNPKYSQGKNAEQSNLVQPQNQDQKHKIIHLNNVRGVNMQDDLFKRFVYGSNWVVNKEGSNKTQYKGPDGRGAVQFNC